MDHRVSARELMALSVLAGLLAVGAALTGLRPERQEIRVVPSASAGAPEVGPAEDDSGPYVNLNTATAEQLMLLPGIGPAKAQAILEHRSRIGRFTTVDSLIEVRGIGPKTVERLRPFLTVAGERQP